MSSRVGGTCLFFFFFNYTATPEIYTLSLHDALPIFLPGHFPVGGRQQPLEDLDPVGSDALAQDDAIGLRAHPVGRPDGNLRSLNRASGQENAEEKRGGLHAGRRFPPTRPHRPRKIA